MKRGRYSDKNKESWEEFEKRVGMKRTGSANAKRAKVPEDLLVQRMSSLPIGKGKKFEPMDTKDFVPFKDYDELSIENIKEACEIFYNAPTGSCDILLSNQGPSCYKMEQIKGKKTYYIRFLPPNEISDRQRVSEEVAQQIFCAQRQMGFHIKKPDTKSAGSVKMSQSLNMAAVPTSSFPKSICVADLLKAGKLVKPSIQAVTRLHLETFDLNGQSWVSKAAVDFVIEEKKFASGGFRNAHMAYSKTNELGTKDWVVKQYKNDAAITIKETLNMPIEDHTRKQVQLHQVASNIVLQFNNRAPAKFGKQFSYNKVYYSTYKDVPVTVEQFVPGEFCKYINNDGQCCLSGDPLKNEIFEKAECLAHFSYVHSNEKLMLLDLQGSDYVLYDPEIATKQLQDGETETETYFCAGNTSYVGISKFLQEHICNDFCDMMNLRNDDI